MFSQTCVKNSVHGGSAQGVSRPRPGGVSRPRGVSIPNPGGCPDPGLGGCPGPDPGGVSQHALRQTPPPPQRTATATNGTHAAGMHSCYVTELVIEYVKMCPVTNSTTFRLYMEHRKSSIGALKVCYVG